mgnify:CR=1 FL=1
MKSLVPVPAPKIPIMSFRYLLNSLSSVNLSISKRMATIPTIFKKMKDNGENKLMKSDGTTCFSIYPKKLIATKVAVASNIWARVAILFSIDQLIL